MENFVTASFFYIVMQKPNSSGRENRPVEFENFCGAIF